MVVSGHSFNPVAPVASSPLSAATLPRKKGQETRCRSESVSKDAEKYLKEAGRVTFQAVQWRPRSKESLLRDMEGFRGV